MTDDVDSVVLANDGHSYVVQIVGVSDGTGEAAVVKVDKSTLVHKETNLEPIALDIRSIRYCVTGYTVELRWDHGTDKLFAALSGAGKFDYSRFGGLRDTSTGDGAGDILLTAPASATTGSYTITLECVLRGARG
jgi:hypothetical protein